MTSEQHRADIALSLANGNINQLIVALAEARAEIDNLREPKSPASGSVDGPPVALQ